MSAMQTAGPEAENAIGGVLEGLNDWIDKTETVDAAASSHCVMVMIAFNTLLQNNSDFVSAYILTLSRALSGPLVGPALGGIQAVAFTQVELVSLIADRMLWALASDDAAIATTASYLFANPKLSELNPTPFVEYFDSCVWQFWQNNPAGRVTISFNLVNVAKVSAATIEPHLGQIMEHAALDGNLGGIVAMLIQEFAKYLPDDAFKHLAAIVNLGRTNPTMSSFTPAILGQIGYGCSTEKIAKESLASVLEMMQNGDAEDTILMTSLQAFKAISEGPWASLTESHIGLVEKLQKHENEYVRSTADYLVDTVFAAMRQSSSRAKFVLAAHPKDGKTCSSTLAKCLRETGANVIVNCKKKAELDDCDSYVVLLSPLFFSEFGRSSCTAEKMLRRAFKRKKPIIPLFLPTFDFGKHTSAIPEEFKVVLHYEGADYVSEAPDHVAKELLRIRISGEENTLFASSSNIAKSIKK